MPDTPPPGISIPLWNVEAPLVGAFLGPNGEDILCTSGTGHIKLPEPPPPLLSLGCNAPIAFLILSKYFCQSFKCNPSDVANVLSK